MGEHDTPFLEAGAADARPYHGQEGRLFLSRLKAPSDMGEKDGIEIGAQGADGRVVGIGGRADARDGQGPLEIGGIQENVVDLRGEQGGQAVGDPGDDLGNQEGIAIALDDQVVLGVQQKIGGEPVVRSQGLKGGQGCQDFHRRGRDHGLLRVVGPHHPAGRIQHQQGVPGTQAGDGGHGTGRGGDHQPQRTNQCES